MNATAPPPQPKRPTPIVEAVGWRLLRSRGLRPTPLLPQGFDCPTGSKNSKKTTHEGWLF